MLRAEANLGRDASNINIAIGVSNQTKGDAFLPRVSVFFCVCKKKRRETVDDPFAGCIRGANPLAEEDTMAGGLWTV